MARRRRVRGRLNCLFYILTLAEPMLMPQMEIGTFQFSHVGQSATYIDLTKSDALANCKAKYQFKNGRPLAYLITVRFSNAANSLETIPTGWVQTNALVKASAAWMRMNKKAGITKKMLNTYGKEMRLPFDGDHKDKWGFKAYDLLADGLVGSYKTGQKNFDGNEIHVYTAVTDPTANPIGGVYESAFEITTVTIPNSSGDAADEVNWSPQVLADGTQLTEKTDSVIYQYITSRGRVDLEDQDMDSLEGMESDNYLLLALSDNEESADDVVDNVKDYGDFRPYDLENLIQTSTVAVSAATNVAGQDTSLVAPLGLLKWNGDSGDKLSVTVSAIVEM